MHSMTQEDTLVVGGVDAHADTHHVAALDQRGALLSTNSFPTTTSGYRELLDWLSGHGEIDVVAVESTGSYAAALVCYLRQHGVRVVEVNQPHAHTRRRVGKSDPIDAEMAARLFQAGKAKAVPKQTDGIVESIRLLRVARHSAVKSRSAALVQVRDLIITAPQELRDQLCCRKTLRGKVTVCARFRPSGREAPLPVASREVRAPLDRSARPSARSGDRRAGSRARAARRGCRAAYRPAARHLDRACRSTARHSRTEHRTTPRRELVRDALRRQSDPCFVRQDDPSPPQLRRRPPSQPGASPDRRLPASLLRAHPRIRQAPNRRRQDSARNHALPQALHRA